MNGPRSERVVANVGCGPLDASALPPYFNSWTALRIDADAAARPDIVADLTDLSAIPDASIDAVWASHCIEHLYEHQVPVALSEFRRVLRAEGFVCVIVPDLQTIANYLVADRMRETLYESDAGPVTPHDIIFGYGAAIARGKSSMAHRCGFTPTTLKHAFQQLPYAQVSLRRRSTELELVAVARADAIDDDDSEALIAALGL